VYDGDDIELSNLNRQILFTPEDTGRNKAETAVLKIHSLLKLPPEIQLHAKSCYCTEESILNDFNSYDFILDCTDSVKLKIALSRIVANGSSLLVYAGVEGLQGTAIIIHPSGPSLEQIFGGFTDEDMATLGGSCQEAGIVGAAAGLTAALQVELLLKSLDENTILKKGETQGYFISEGQIHNKLFYA
jgi:molybdopterin/thiamine biosynthesis adenylyltransferase